MVLLQLLSADELDQLTPEEIAELTRAIQHELLTSDDVKRLLRSRVEQILRRLGKGPTP